MTAPATRTGRDRKSRRSRRLGGGTLLVVPVHSDCPRRPRTPQEEGGAGWLSCPAASSLSHYTTQYTPATPLSRALVAHREYTGNIPPASPTSLQTPSARDPSNSPLQARSYPAAVFEHNSAPHQTQSTSEGHYTDHSPQAWIPSSAGAPVPEAVSYLWHQPAPGALVAAPASPAAEGSAVLLAEQSAEQTPLLDGFAMSHRPSAPPDASRRAAH